MTDGSVPAGYFQDLYARDPDPWHFASSEYERDKYAATLAAIGDTEIARAWEVGCSIGVFTESLAARCGALLAVDVAKAALDQARRNCIGRPNVTFQLLSVPREWPEGQFDLIVFSEVLYFLSAADIRLTARRAVETLSSQGRIVLVNWTGETGHALSGDAAAETFHEVATADLTTLCRERRPGYRLDLYRRPSA
jgi:trans-aconitate methyltransferase